MNWSPVRPLRNDRESLWRLQGALPNEVQTIDVAVVGPVRLPAGQPDGFRVGRVRTGAYLQLTECDLLRGLRESQLDGSMAGGVAPGSENPRHDRRERIQRP